MVLVLGRVRFPVYYKTNQCLIWIDKKWRSSQQFVSAIKINHSWIKISQLKTCIDNYNNDNFISSKEKARVNNRFVVLRKQYFLPRRPLTLWVFNNCTNNFQSYAIENSLFIGGVWSGEDKYTSSCLVNSNFHSSHLRDQ